MKRFIIAFTIFATVGCAPPAAVGGRSTANLTAPGIRALQTTEVVKVLDIIRDTAIDGNATNVISTPTTTKIVTWHKVTLQTIQSTPDGWKTTVLSGLDNLKSALPSNEVNIIGPYIDSAKSLIEAVIQ